jgi:hypothetical protein
MIIVNSYFKNRELNEHYDKFKYKLIYNIKIEIIKNELIKHFFITPRKYVLQYIISLILLYQKMINTIVKIN